jgi:hypothetical protein
MLKIKDDVDLKDLKKYGFGILYSEATGEPISIYTNRGFPYCDNKSTPFIFFKKKKRIIFQNAKSKIFGMDVVVPDNHCNRVIFLDKLYDLIKADLVEKIDD